jgi:hypothetical protein
MRTTSHFDVRFRQIVASDPSCHIGLNRPSVGTSARPGPLRGSGLAAASMGAGDTADAVRQEYRIVPVRGSQYPGQKVITFQEGGPTVTTVELAEHRLIKVPKDGSSSFDSAKTWEITQPIDPFA